MREDKRKFTLSQKDIFAGVGKFKYSLKKDKSTDEIIKSFLDLINSKYFAEDFVVMI